ncbi:hypothetical protein [Microbacterium esteraromaticum]|uniref:hypothetical protein n=1 Tax=Microbacterium esteraromaticum TaxID=57043 RepID=UPI001C96709C|nr:hypothetical protein [Microbacterium esteraromaticum]MBY6061967.1 hypothetical protein [Microbacterium esteraromaticum]
MAREYIAVSQDFPLDAVGVDLRFAPIGDVDDVTDRVATIAAERRQAAALEAEAIAHAAGLARDLVAADVPIRDIGAILGISHQRVHQLTSTR